MGNKTWKIFYSKYEGAQKRAVDLVYRELGNYQLRDTGVYSFHAVACENQETLPRDCHAVVLGRYVDNPVMQSYLQANEVAENGYVVKVMDHPENPACKLVLLCGDTDREVFYAAADFVDDYFTVATPSVDAYIHLRHELLEQRLPDYYHASAPSFKTRSVFTWGHPINDYRQYFENLARLKFNQVIVWNDFLPLNADDIVECAHSYGMELIWGYAWGWGFNCKESNVRDLDVLKDSIVQEFCATYQHAKCDGIYFQSFTELSESSIDGISVASAVVKLVNMTANELFKYNPDLHIQFGLHASSVKENIADIAQVDDRIEIVWEDCGGFPYKASPISLQLDECDFEEQTQFADNILCLRDGGKSGIVYKCLLTMDWSRGRVTHQAGRYVMGETGDGTKQHDERLLADIWRFYSAEWVKHGERAYALTRHIHETSSGTNTMCLAGMFSGGVWFPTAMCAEMFWDCEQDYSALRDKVLKRQWVRF